MPDTDRTPLVRTTATEDCLSVAVCDLVSRLTDASIDDLPPLANTIDPDALEAVFRSDAASGMVAFEYAGYDVVVRSNDAVEVYEAKTVTE